MHPIQVRARHRLNGLDPVNILIYNSYGNAHRIHIKGRVLENKGELDARDNDTLWRNLVNMYRRLESDEVPHAVAVDVDEMATRPTGDVYIRATIYVERDSQKGIIIGAKGSMLKQVGALARKDIEALLGSKVYLDLWVKVKKDWRNRDNVLKGFGFD